MIHLDQNHSPSIAPHAKSNLILNSNPHADQQSILSWSSSARDDRPFYQDQHQPQLADKPSTSSINTDSLSTPPDSLPYLSPPKPPTPPNNIAPHTSERSKPPQSSSTSPPDARSPAIESSSSLSPLPDTTSPAFPTAPLSGPDPSISATTDQSAALQAGTNSQKPDEVDNASRASTPLSELSSAPDIDDPPGQRSTTVSSSTTLPLSTMAQPMTEDSKRMPNPSTGPSLLNGHAGASLAKSSSPSRMAPSVSFPRNMSPAGPIRERSMSVGIGSVNINENSVRAVYASAVPPKADPKVVAVLELNTHLLKVFMELQARGILPNDPRCQPYSARLQSNLTWLAAAADEGRKVTLSQVPLPNMQAPPPSEFVAMDRVLQLYSELPNLFAKDIARRQQSHAGQHLPGQTPSPALKRDRSDDSSDPTNKRRDTGDTKMAPTPASSNSSPHQPSVLPSAPISASHNVPLHGMPPSNASMPPPSVHSMPGVGSNDAQLAASRARQLQMRQVLQQQQLGDGNRQISPPGVQQPGMQGGGMAGPSNLQQQQQAQLSAIASMGPAAIQAYQILQNHAHPIVQYLNQTVPSFSSLPLQQQLQRVQMVAAMHARSQQQRNAAAMQSQAGNPSANFAPGGVPSMSNSSLPGGIQNGSPTRSSPISQQSPAASQSQPGLFPNTGQSAAMDPRSAFANLTPQQQANLANMNPQQRQLLLLQHQQFMRGGNTGGSAMMNPQVLAQQQRLAQAGSPTHGNPTMVGMSGVGSDGASFPALRSNPGVPGIARSIRTPSDHMQSPITPQLPQRTPSQTQEDFQRAMLQQGQRGMTPGQDGSYMQMNSGGMQNVGWSQNTSASMTSSQGTFRMTPPHNAGVAQGSFGGMSNRVSSPVGNSNWSQGGAGPFVSGSPTGNQQGAEGVSVPRQTSMTPVPHPQMSQGSPVVGDQSGLNDFDLFNWGQ